MKLSLLLAHAQAFRKKDEIKLPALDRFSKMLERRKLDLATRCRIAPYGEIVDARKLRSENNLLQLCHFPGSFAQAAVE